MSLLLGAADPLSHVAQYMLPSLTFGDGFFTFPLFSNHILMQLITAGLLIFFIPRFVARRAGSDEIGQLTPRGSGNLIEMICLALRDNIFKPNLHQYTNAFSPFLWSLFFFVLISNLLGMLPLVDWLYFLGDARHYIGGASTGNIWVTSALAIVVFIMVVYNGLTKNGFDWIKHFFMGPWWLSWFIALLEIAGLVAKCAALAIRLFANMLAGHVLLAAVLGFVGPAFQSLGTGGGWAVTIAVYFGSVAIYMLEIFVTFLHAFIFTVLTAVFVGQAIHIHHDDDHGEEHAAAH